jgi:hypothetical protein
MGWDVKESWSQSTSVTVAESGERGTTDHTRNFTALADLVGYTTLDALLAPGIPRRNDPHPQNFALRARRFNPIKVSPIYFEISVGYEAPISDPNDPANNPLAQPAEIEFSAVTQEVEIDEDINGDPIETVNGEPLQGVTRPFTDLVITVTRNLPSFNPASISEFTNKVNSTEFIGCPAGTVRIMDINAKSVFSNDFPYFIATVSFQIRRGFGPVTDAKAWWYRTAHQGYIVKVGGNKEVAKATDGFTVPQPVMIHLTTGEQLADGVGAYIDFEVLESIDFNTLNLL